MNKACYLFFVLLIGMLSCVSHKKTVYLQKAGEGGAGPVPYKKTPYRIRSQDILQISVTSLNPQVSEFFNQKTTVTSKEDLKGYPVSDSGFIYMPVLDSIYVKGLTLPEAKSKVQKLVREHVTDANIDLKLAGFNITVLGEVRNPGLIPFTGTELTVLEAIGMASDISDFGNRKNVTLIREEEGGTRFISLDLTRRDLVASEYFYLQPNDVLYVEPLRAKTFKQNIGQISLVLGFTSIAFFLINSFRK